MQAGREPLDDDLAHHPADALRGLLRRQATRKSGVNIADVTSLFTALRVMGPLSRAVLSELTETDMSPKSFPFFAVKEMDIGSASGIRATNLTQTVVVTEFHETLFLNQF